MKLLKLIPFFLITVVFGQDVAYYTIDDAATTRDNFVSYDGGNMLLVFEEGNYYNSSFLKTNRKGEELWRMELSSEDKFQVSDFAPLSNGDFIVSGQTIQYWPEGYAAINAWDGVLMRVNVCGEVEWLKIVRRFLSA